MARRLDAAHLEEMLPAASDRELQSRFEGTTWTRCNSWYRDDTGRIVTNWPGYMSEYAERVRELDPDEFVLVPASAPAASAPASAA